MSSRDIGDLSVRVVHDDSSAHGRSFKKAFQNTSKRGDEVYQALEKRLLESTDLISADENLSLNQPSGRSTEAAPLPPMPSPSPSPSSAPSRPGSEDPLNRPGSASGLSSDFRAPVDFAGRMKAAGVTFPVTIKGMSGSALFLLSPLAPVDPSLELRVGFEIKTRLDDIGRGAHRKPEYARRRFIDPGSQDVEVMAPARPQAKELVELPLAPCKAKQEMEVIGLSRPVTQRAHSEILTRWQLVVLSDPAERLV